LASKTQQQQQQQQTWLSTRGTNPPFDIDAASPSNMISFSQINKSIKGTWAIDTVPVPVPVPVQ